MTSRGGKGKAGKGQQVEDAEVKSRLEQIKELYGMVPLVPQVLSERPDLFLPYFDLSEATLFHPQHLDRKTLELAAVAAGSALASEHCLTVHIDQARRAGASKDELLEAILVGALMSMTKSQSVSLRVLKDMNIK